MYKYIKTVHPEYSVWNRMMQRCYNPKCAKYKNYGARGIEVCKRWRNSFKLFLKDMGQKPSEEYSIERVDVNGNYCKENCKWATVQEQNKNRTTTKIIEYKGRKMCLKDWCRELNLSYKMVTARINNLGWKPEKAFETPCRYQNKGTWEDKNIMI